MTGNDDPLAAECTCGGLSLPEKWWAKVLARLNPPPAAQCPACPLCGEPPSVVFGGGTQAFCDNEACRVFAWNQLRGREEQLADAVEIPDPLQERDDGC